MNRCRPQADENQSFRPLLREGAWFSLAAGFCLIACCLGGCQKGGKHRNSPTSAPTGKLNLVTREVSLGKLPPMAVWTNLIVSADNRHVAYPVLRARGWTVSLDGVEGTNYREIRCLTFSPDGRRLAYGAVRGDKCLVIVDGREDALLNRELFRVEIEIVEER